MEWSKDLPLDVLFAFWGGEKLPVPPEEMVADLSGEGARSSHHPSPLAWRGGRHATLSRPSPRNGEGEVRGEPEVKTLRQ